MKLFAAGVWVMTLLVAGCGEDTPPSQAEGDGGTADFVVVSTWEPQVTADSNGSLLRYSLKVQNSGSSSGSVSCSIFRGEERLEGDSTTPELEPGATGTVEGEVHVDSQPDQLALEDLTPECE